ncbi:ferrochelatase [Zavarzinia sp. CC-PAN008]|uniref:ferrochelatase n=1 Tax=Zavarzinia sp. CC-PAN008 TaxID=3243332 RepID=UPI003F742ED0
MSRVAVVLFNLGGPDSLDAVRPFLMNLFSDPAIIRLPGPLRRLVAWLITRRRTPTAQGIYAQMGGRSPILPLTEAQASALEQALGAEARVFIAMRYWHPLTAQTAKAVAAFKPDRIVLLPLYPQFSTTTTASSLREWQRHAGHLKAAVHTVCCYPDQPDFVAAHVATIRGALADPALAGSAVPPRLLFSAHGLPEKVVKDGDPYQWQVERSAAAIVAGLGVADLDWRISYQSRVGPLKWIGPSTEHEIEVAGQEGRPLVVVPIAFVSEHSETLVELDIEYRDLAEEKGVPAYVRVPALGVAGAFVDGLAAMVRAACGRSGTCPAGGQRICPMEFTGCPAQAAAAAPVGRA